VEIRPDGRRLPPISSKPVESRRVSVDRDVRRRVFDVVTLLDDENLVVVKREGVEKAVVDDGNPLEGEATPVGLL